MQNTNLFEQAIQMGKIYIERSFRNAFIPISRRLIESDKIQQQLFKASDKLLFSAGDSPLEQEIVVVKNYGESDDCLWAISKTYHQSEIAEAPEESREILRASYELIIELSLSPEYLMRWHWGLYLPSHEPDTIHSAPCHQWLLNINVEDMKILGSIDYFAGKSPEASAETFTTKPASASR